MIEKAPGAPGIPARWTSSAKSGVGRAMAPQATVWYTASHGILNEVYYPRVDQACLRDMELIVTDGKGFFSEEKRHTKTQFSCFEDGVPGFHIVNTCKQGRYRIDKEIFADPHRDVLVQRVRFVPLQGRVEDYHVYVLVSPHIDNRGSGNNGVVGDYKGVPMLFAYRGACALAVSADVPWGPRSVGYVGTTDGWQDLSRHFVLTQTYARADDGNVALVGELLLADSDGVATIALGFGRDINEAGHRARWTLLKHYDETRTLFVEAWRAWQSTLPALRQPNERRDLYRTSTAVLATHESTSFPGGFIASLSVPWGFDKGDDNLGGYHLVWPRDLVETVGGLLAAGATDDVHRVIHYLHVTQEADGHWPQNMWMDGTPYWSGYQLDETAFPILLLDLARREGVLQTDGVARAWPMVKRAAGFLVRTGPVTQEDRWEEDAGYSPFTLAVEIAALLAAADFADQHGEAALSAYLRDVADCWNACVERWTYARGTALAERHGVDGYYVRIAPPDTADAASPVDGFVQIKNRPPGQDEAPASAIVSPDALALVRFGLRAADDPRILATVKVIDGELRAETPFGPCWRRYNEDGYGEHEDGAPFDGTGVGRLWPLLTGERGHYELAAGRVHEAETMLAAMEGFANEGGMIPEQIWDGPDIPARDLFFARPTGSAMPLVWAHAEYIKLRRSLRDGRVFDMPAQTVRRYIDNKTPAPVMLWRANNKARSVRADQRLRVESTRSMRVRWTTDDWATQADTTGRDSGLGMWYADLTPGDAGTRVTFTLQWLEDGAWMGENFSVAVTEGAPPA